MKEIWKDIPEYEGLYQASNLGRIKSIAKEKKKILKPAKCNNNYLLVALYKNKIRKSIQVHQLVAMAFLNHAPCGHKIVVNHINFNKEDNRVSNLELVTNRENCNKKHLKSTSYFVGVYWDKSRSKWVSRIQINGKNINLGRFENELEAHEAYQKRLKEINN